MTTTTSAELLETLHRGVEIHVDGVQLTGDLAVPSAPVGSVVFADRAGGTCLSSRNLHVAEELNRAGLATLLVDLLTEDEEAEHADPVDIHLLGRRLQAATLWLSEHGDGRLPLGYFGAGTGAAAALWAASNWEFDVRAVVSGGGRPDLAAARLGLVRAPTLLVVGGVDAYVLERNRAALEQLHSCEHDLVVVPGATHSFEQYGALERVTELAVDWFLRHLPVAEAA